MRSKMLVRHAAKTFLPRSWSFTSVLRSLSTQQKLYSISADHFGYETVDESQKADRVYQVFRNVAKRYDVMNDAMSFGIHRLWKDYFVAQLFPSPDMKVLDAAGGTGDIAFRIIQHCNARFQAAPDVTVLDVNEKMIKAGKKRADQGGYGDLIKWTVGDAERLPFDDDTFDAYTIAFGIRNCTHIESVLREARRVLKPTGRFLCLEFSTVQDCAVLEQVYDLYSFQLIPVIGHVLAGDWKSYQYLVESIRRFPDAESFQQLIEEANFDQVKHTKLMNGIACIHSGFKI